MFQYLVKAGAAAPVVCHFVFEGQTLQGHAGESVAAAVLRAGVSRLRRHPVDGSPRMPFCMMGVCQECLVQVGDADRTSVV